MKARLIENSDLEDGAYYLDEFGVRIDREEEKEKMFSGKIVADEGGYIYAVHPGMTIAGACNGTPIDQDASWDYLASFGEEIEI